MCTRCPEGPCSASRWLMHASVVPPVSVPKFRGDLYRNEKGTFQRPLMTEPFAAQAPAVAQQPVAADQRMAGLDLAGFEHRFQFGDRFDNNPDVLVLFG